MGQVGLGVHFNADDFGNFADATRGAEKKVQNAIRKALREAGKPLAASVIREGSEPMPARGGLRAQLQQGKPSVLSTFGKTPRVTLKLATRKGHGLDTINRGVLRHPVYPHGSDRKKWKWTRQNVPGGTYTAAFEKHAPDVRRQALKAMEQTLDEIAREV